MNDTQKKNLTLISICGWDAILSVENMAALAAGAEPTSIFPEVLANWVLPPYDPSNLDEEMEEG